MEENNNSIFDMIHSNRQKLINHIKFETPKENLKINQTKNKHYYNYDGFNLDLTYITDRIIAMCFPYEHFREDLKKLFNLRHNNKIKVYNLCSEMSYDEKLFDNFSHFPFDDHEVPKFEIIFDFCRNLDDWLKSDEENVAVIHCKAGIGRTGTMICSYLLYIDFLSHSDHVITFFKYSRMLDGQGLKNPSQLRYINYFHNALQMKMESPFSFNKVLFESFSMRHFSKPIQNDFINEEIIFYLCILNADKNEKHEFKFINQDDSFILQFDKEICSNVILSGDVKFSLFLYNLKTNIYTCIFYIYINTLFISVKDYNQIVFKKYEIDMAFKDKDNLIFDNDFEVVLNLNKTY